MKQNEILDIHKIIMKTLKIIPKDWDMNHQNFNSNCHMELTNKTYELIGNRFETTPEESKKIIDNYFIITNGKV